MAVLSQRYGAEFCSYIGIIGTDEAGSHVIQALEQEGIDVARIRQAFGENGEAVVSLNDDGDRVFVGGNKGGVQNQLMLYLNQDDIAYIHTYDVLHTSVYSHLEGALFSGHGTRHHQGIVETEQVVDTLGAGDAFIAAFLTHYHDHKDMVAALQGAAEFAAKTCSYYGAFGYGVRKTKTQIALKEDACFTAKE